MKIVVDKNIPFIQKPLEGLGEIVYLKGDAITPEVMRDADILLTRTRTRCDSRLLDGSRCSFIGTATIGTDHIDLGYCKEKGITVANAPGCNAPARNSLSRLSVLSVSVMWVRSLKNGLNHWE